MQISALRVWALGTAVGMALLMGAGAAGGAPPSTTTECNDGDARTSVVKRTIKVGKSNRVYWLSVPPDVETNAPLLVSLHGSWGKGRLGCSHAGETGWASYSIDSGRRYVVVFPDAAGGTGWADGGFTFNSGSKDVQFVRAVVDAVSAEVSIDPTRVYVTGHSWGAFFAQFLACDAEDLFASATSYAGGDIGTKTGGVCDLSRGIAVGHWHGDNDDVIEIHFGQEARDAWASRNLCMTRSPASGEPARVTWSDCLDSVKVEWTVLTGQTHDWPSGGANDAMRSGMWTFFDAFPLP